MLVHVLGDIFIRDQNTDVTCAESKHHRAIDGLHCSPVFIEIDGNIFVVFSRYRFCIGNELFADMAGRFPDMGMDVDNHRLLLQDAVFVEDVAKISAVH